MFGIFVECIVLHDSGVVSNERDASGNYKPETKECWELKPTEGMVSNQRYTHTHTPIYI